MDTSLYLYFGYLAFWLVPAAFLIRLSRKIVQLEDSLQGAESGKGHERP